MMNPYEVLGVSENASPDEIKAAYRELVKKYHPDQYQNNPLAGLAEEKLREVNEAYDMLMKNGGGAYHGASYETGSFNDGAVYQQIRAALNQNNIIMAQQLLATIQGKDAEWFYLQGILNYKRGWFNEAFTNIQEACRRDPSNLEYRNTYNTMQSQGSGYQDTVYRRRDMGGNIDACDCCIKLWCADSCCECMGGDFIPCC